MLPFNRVFAHVEDRLWVGVPWLAERIDLEPEFEYVVLPVAQPGAVCLTLPDKRILCDFGPDHDHG